MTERATDSTHDVTGNQPERGYAKGAMKGVLSGRFAAQVDESAQEPDGLSLWQILAEPGRASAVTVRAACGVLAIGLTALGVLAFGDAEQAAPVARGAVLATAAYALLGAVVGPSLPALVYRAYSIVLVIVAALATAYASVVTGNHPAGVAIAGLTVFVAVLCLPSGSDYLFVDVALPGSWAAVLLAGEPPQIGRLPVLLIWAGALGCANAVGLATLVFRAWTTRGRVILHNARQERDEARRARLDFVNNAAHEIRNRLTGVQFGTDSLFASSLTNDQREHLHTIRDAGENVLELLDDMSDVVDMEVARLMLQSLPFDLQVVIRDQLEPLGRKAKAKGVDLVWEIRDEIPSHLIGDPRRLAQVFKHIVGNAVKYTDSGQIDVTVTSGPWKAREAVINVEVSDTGIGIEDSKRKSIFEMFSRADASTGRELGGAGIGLKLCHDLVRLMGGSITVDSKPGVGSTFRFSVCLRKRDDRRQPTPQPQPTRPPTESEPHGLRILLAEDTQINRTLVRRALVNAGHSVVAVENGKQAVEAFDNDDFDVVLMDVEMPVMDGLTALRAIRDRERERGTDLKTPIIALTAHAMVGDRERLLADGMDDYIPKPVRKNVLLDTIDKVLARTPADGVPRAHIRLESEPEPLPSSSSPRLIDPEIIRDQIGDDHALLEDLIVNYRKQRYDILNQIKEKLNQGESAAAAAAAHKLKGSLLALGAMPAAEAAARVEEAAREDGQHQARTALAELEQETSRLDRELGGLLIRTRAGA